MAGRAVDPLIEVLKDPKRYGDVDILIARVCNALGAIGDARAVEPLIAIIKKWHGMVGAEDEGVDPGMRGKLITGAACRALGNIGDARAVEILTEVATDDSKWGYEHLKNESVREIAASALVKMGVPVPAKSSLSEVT